eukprot:TRINITY_DN15825_c0_g1_i1.p1 TRINITY_DN15825_c0_g1~~TRINITY_DN15825_c0_g1_i1.p1  ORF type:complete len:934 (+),score=162.95 TRINITY_DN15825_c0_g1_i1:102-2903(+)
MPQNYTAWPRIGSGQQRPGSTPVTSGLPTPSSSFVVSAPYGSSNTLAPRPNLGHAPWPGAGTSFGPLSGTPSGVPTPVPSSQGPAVQWSMPAGSKSVIGAVPTPVPSMQGPGIPWSMPGVPPGYRMVYAGAPYGACGAAASKLAHQKSQEDWLEPLIRNLWPKITAYIEKMVKQKLHDQHINVDEGVRSAMSALSKHPPPIPFGKDWINILLKTLWPLVKGAAENMLKETVLPKLREKVPSFMQSIDISPCTLGDAAPQLKYFEVLDNSELGNNCWLGLHMQVEYDGDADIKVVYKGMGAGVKHIKARLDVFINFSGKSNVIPFVKGLSVHVDNLGFSMDWTGAADFLDIAFLEDLIHNIAKKTVQNMAVLPQRIAVSLQPMGADIFDLVRPRPKGFLKIELVGITGLKGNEISLTTFMGGGKTVDPFVELQIGSQVWKSTTVSRCLDPTWEKDNTFIFLIDSPCEQVLDIRVFDEDLSSGLRMKMGGGAADTIARALDLHMHQLLAKGANHHFKEEVQSDLTIPLALWWPGQGKGPEEEDFETKTEEKELPTETMTEAERVQVDKESREEEEHNRHEHAQEELRKKREAFEEKQRALDEERAAASADAGVFTKVKNWFKREAAEAVEWVVEEAEYIIEEAEHLVEVVKDEAVYLKEKAVEKIHTNREASEQSRKDLLLEADSKIHLRLNWRPIGDAIKPAMFPRGGGITQPNLQRMLDKAPKISAASETEDPPEWPAYALLVGVAKVDKIIVEDETACYVTCDVTPVMGQDGKKVLESKDDVTKKKSSVVKSSRASVAGLTPSIDDSRVMARKIGICLRNGMDVSSIAQVLDIPEKKVLNALGSTIVERSDCVDINFNEDFVYFLHAPQDAIIDLEVFRNGKSIGKRRLGIAPLLEKPGLTQDIERLPLENAVEDNVIPRLTGRVQLWPIGK